MPRIVDAPQQDAIELAEVVEALESGFDNRDEDNFASWGSLLRRLANNRTFLPNLMIAELKDRCADQVRDNQYSAQVIMLHGGRNFYMRANLWPAMNDSIVRHSGTDPFFYGVPHDHNFSFLTVGYFGPGYWSEYYEYDYDKVIGYLGEPVDLRFVEKTRLEQGKVMLYRAHRDIHLQLPADEMSVSLNIVEGAGTTPYRDQYRFDVENRNIAGIMTRTSAEPLLAIAAHCGGEEGMDLISAFASRHPSERMRWSALQAQAGAAPSLDERIAVFEAGTRSDSPLVSKLAVREIAKLESCRDWIERGPETVAA